MNNSAQSTTDIVVRMEQDHIKFIDLQFTDVVGMVKNVTIPTHELKAALENGVWFDGSSIDGFARVAESDMHLRPDPLTFAIIPWLTGEEATARLICDVYTPDGQPFPGDPRSILRRVINDAAQMGFGYNTGPELEFFLLKPNADGSLMPLAPHDSASYFDAPADMAAGLRRQMATTLEALGLQVEAMHHEGADGQQEIDFRYSDALTTADSAVTLARGTESDCSTKWFVLYIPTQTHPGNQWKRNACAPEFACIARMERTLFPILAMPMAFQKLPNTSLPDNWLMHAECVRSCSLGEFI